MVNVSHRRLLIATVRIVSVVFGVAVAAMLAAAIRFSGPQIEAHLFPIIKASHVAHSVRFDPDHELCWSVHYVKYRNDVPAYFNYRIVFRPDPDPEFPDNPLGQSRVPLAVYRIRPDGSKVYLSTSGFANHSVSDGPWVANYCAELPRGLKINTPLTVEGEGFYTSWHGLWLVPQELPDFTVRNLGDVTSADPATHPLSRAAAVP